MIFNAQNLLHAFDKKDAYHSPRCFSTVVQYKLNRFEPKDYAVLPKEEVLTAHLYSIWEDKYTQSLNFRIVNRNLEVIL